MKSKRLWALVIGSVLTAFLFVACGGGSTGYVKVAHWDGSEWDIQQVDKLENVFTGSSVPGRQAP